MLKQLQHSIQKVAEVSMEDGKVASLPEMMMVVVVRILISLES